MTASTTPAVAMPYSSQKCGVGPRGRTGAGKAVPAHRSVVVSKRSQVLKCVGDVFQSRPSMTEVPVEEPRRLAVDPRHVPGSQGHRGTRHPAAVTLGARDA